MYVYKYLHTVRHSDEGRVDLYIYIYTAVRTRIKGDRHWPQCSLKRTLYMRIIYK